MKNTSQSKEQPDNTQTEKTEQVTADMKQGLRTLGFYIESFLKEIQTINNICGSSMCRDSWHITASVQTREPIIFLYLLNAQNERE